ncbi:MAG: hypothetical protein MHPSP_000661, partial [Paramarteilia canceri]
MRKTNGQNKENVPMVSKPFSSFKKIMSNTPKKIKTSILKRFSNKNSVTSDPNAKLDANYKSRQDFQAKPQFLMPCNRLKVSCETQYSQQLLHRPKSSKQLTVPQSPNLCTKKRSAMTPVSKRSISCSCHYFLIFFNNLKHQFCTLII